MQTTLHSRITSSLGLAESAVAMSRERILIVDDEEDLRELLSYNLAKEGYRVDTVATGEGAIDFARRHQPNLIILDLLLPRVDGLEVCRILKSEPRSRHIPIMMLTAKTEDADVVAGLELGADDYVLKPFTPRVLMARIKAVLRRKQVEETDEEEEPVQAREIVIHPGRHEVSLGGKRIDLTYTEFRLLHFLARKPGWAFTRTQIVDSVRGEDYPVTERSVDVQVASLRKKLGRFGKYIETVRGVGYRFKE